MQQLAHPNVRPLPISSLLPEPLCRLLHPLEPALARLLGTDRLIQCAEQAFQCGRDDSFAANLLRLMNIEYRIAPADLSRIPASGAAVIAANHPFGLLEGAVLLAILPQIRPDFKIVANSILTAVPALQERFICVNPFGGRESILENRSPLRHCISWLRQGHLLVIFPAGEVAQVDWRAGGVVDPPWHPAAARIVRAIGCPSIPMFFPGANSFSFHLAGVVHPRLRTVNLAREFLNKAGKSVEVRVGHPIAASLMRSLRSEEEAIVHLRARAHLLGRRPVGGRNWLRPRLPFRWRQERLAPLIEPTPKELQSDEVARLAPDREMCSAGEFSVFLAGASEIPNVLREIGRLRESAFRAVGEGTGKSSDTDTFDKTYLHLFLWNREAKEIAGAYRLAPTPDILARYGASGLYTSTLFRYHPRFFERMGPAMELGRSFICPEYQKHYLPLLLLWKGINHFVRRRPELAVLFGAVSISNEYSVASKNLIVSYLNQRRADQLAQFVKPRRAFHETMRLAEVVSALRDPDELSDPVSDIETDGKGIPVLLRHYTKSGGKLISLNVDARFSNALDALIMVDLRQVPSRLLNRYMSPEGSQVFRAYHGVPDRQG